MAAAAARGESCERLLEQSDLVVKASRLGSVLVSTAVLKNHHKSSVLNNTELLSYSSGVQKPDMDLTGLKSRASWTSQAALVVKSPPANAGDIRDVGSIPGSGRSPGGGHSSPLQYSCLENPMDRGAWQATVHRALTYRAAFLSGGSKAEFICLFFPVSRGCLHPLAHGHLFPCSKLALAN